MRFLKIYKEEGVGKTALFFFIINDLFSLYIYYVKATRSANTSEITA
jgi:hypothetical protein